MGDTHPGGTWGAYVESLGQRPGWTTTRLARESGIGRATIYKWRNGVGGVTVDSVLRIATTVGDDPDVALRAAGGRLVNESEDPQLRDIYDADLPDATKQELVQYVLDQRASSEESLRKQVQLMIRAGERRAG